MARLTAVERQRVFFAQQASSRHVLMRLSTAPIVSAEPRDSRHRLRQVVQAMTIVTLLGGGWLAVHALALHPPASIVEALLPRL